MPPMSLVRKKQVLIQGKLCPWVSMLPQLFSSTMPGGMVPIQNSLERSSTGRLPPGPGSTELKTVARG